MGDTKNVTEWRRVPVPMVPGTLRRIVNRKPDDVRRRDVVKIKLSKLGILLGMVAFLVTALYCWIVYSIRVGDPSSGKWLMMTPALVNFPVFLALIKIFPSADYDRAPFLISLTVGGTLQWYLIGACFGFIFSRMAAFFWKCIKRFFYSRKVPGAS